MQLEPVQSSSISAMTPSQWSWLLALMGVLGMYFVGKKRWEAFLWLIVMECLWIVYALQTRTYGFIFGSLAYMFVYIKSAHLWKQEVRNE